MNNLSSSVNISLEWRRNKVQKLASQGYNQTQIAKILQISESTISRDLDLLRQQSKENIKKYIDERLPEEYEKCLVGLNAITKEAWNTALNTEDKREKMLLTSITVQQFSVQDKVHTQPNNDSDKVYRQTTNQNNNHISFFIFFHAY